MAIRHLRKEAARACQGSELYGSGRSVQLMPAIYLELSVQIVKLYDGLVQSDQVVERKRYCKLH